MLTKYLSKANKCEDLLEMRKLVAEADSFKNSSKEKRKIVDEYGITIQKMGERTGLTEKKVVGMLLFSV